MSIKKETSHIEIKINGKVVSTRHQDLNDAWADAVNQLVRSGDKAIITQTIEITKA